MMRSTIAPKKNKDERASTSQKRELDQNQGDFESLSNAEQSKNDETAKPNDNQSTANTDEPAKKKKRYSAVWQHFTIQSEDGNEVAHCNYCEKFYAISGKNNGSTSNMKRHLTNKHPDTASSEETEINAFEFSKERYREALVKWIVTCNQPFTEVEQEAFLELIQTLNPDAVTISSETVKRDIIKKFEEKVEEVKVSLIKAPGKISITMDAWTSKNTLPFMAIRAHWISSDWIYQTVLLDFSYIEGSHKGANFCDIFLQCLKQFDLPLSKVLAVTMDNVTSNDTLMDALQTHGIRVGVKVTAAGNRVRCMAHIINLSVQDILGALKIPLNNDVDGYEHLDNLVEDDEGLHAVGLEEEGDEDEADDLDLESATNENELLEGLNKATILKLRKLVKKIRKSPQMRQKLKKHCEFFGVRYLVPIIDVATRWNSTYEMLKRAEFLKIPLRALCLNEKKLNGLVIDESEWKVLNSLKTLLEKFERSTKLMSMERHPTIPSYIPTLNWLLESLETFIKENAGPMSEAAKRGLEKLQKYEKELQIKTSQIPYVATFLNPALKMSYFKEHNYSKQSIKEIQQNICGLFETTYGTSGEAADEQLNEGQSDEFFDHMFKRTKVTKQPKEFQKYINCPLSAANVNVLDYWRAQVTEFPNLSKMAMDYLAVQSGSVAVERDFSGGADLVTPTRCSLQEQTIRACMCLKSWIKHSKSQPR